MRRPKSWLKQKPNEAAVGLATAARLLRGLNTIGRATERLLRRGEAMGVSPAVLEKLRLQMRPPISDESIQFLEGIAAAYRRHPNARNWEGLESARRQEGTDGK